MTSQFESILHTNVVHLVGQEILLQLEFSRVDVASIYTHYINQSEL